MKKEYKTKIYSASERVPENGQPCWVFPADGGQPLVLYYNAHYFCWDDMWQDDRYSDINRDDIWMALPRLEEIKECIE